MIDTDGRTMPSRGQTMGRTRLAVCTLPLHPVVSFAFCVGRLESHVRRYVPTVYPQWAEFYKESEHLEQCTKKQLSVHW